MSNMKRILNDIKQAKSLEDCGIFICVDEEKATEVHAVIQGVDDTPYYGGFFYFTLIFPSNYPLSPPKVTLRTTGNGTVRFNPNLYSCGKVCLSILGTWSGPGWTPGLTLSSVLLSIQTLLCPQPMLNEPGYENHSNVAELKAYNNIIQHETLRVALITNIKAILNGTSRIPTELHEHILTRFADYAPYVTNTCHELGPSLNKKVMQDPFRESRGSYCFSDILKQFQSLLTTPPAKNVMQKQLEKDVVSIEEEVDEKITLSEASTSQPHGESEKEVLKDIEEPIPEELKCGVCFDILATPAVLECGHVFCYHCALRWLERNPICPTCRERQGEVTKLRRIFTLDMICDREAKLRNKAISSTRVEEDKGGDDDDDNDNDLEEKTFESSYEMWCARRDEGIALDNGKKLEASKASGRRNHHGHYGYDDEYYSDDDYDDDFDGGYGGGGNHMVPGMSYWPPTGPDYFNSVGGSGNVLGCSTEASGTVDQKEARLKRFAACGSASSSSKEASLPSPPAPVKATPQPLQSQPTQSSYRFLSPEEREMEMEKAAREAELKRLKRDKAEKARERKRLQIEIEHDRKERKKNCGVLPSTHDSLFSSRAPVDTRVTEVLSGRSGGTGTSLAEDNSSYSSLTNTDCSATIAVEDKALETTRKVDSLLDVICKPFEQTTSVAITSAAEVDAALNLLLKVLGNVIDNPQVEKYRSINTTGKMYKEKLARVLGVQRLLHALGFKKDSSGSLQLNGFLQSNELCVIIETRDKIMSIVECRKIAMAASS
mmetsp:Transcript_15769/g.26347  ORF Transcript_15769/g.26347 Transcript_15769/m.26347 type:complete len:774 (+) Transcript_15769:104-2425(+)